MIRFDLVHPTLCLGVVSAEEVRFLPTSPSLDGELSQAESRVRADKEAFPEGVRAAIRNVLRKGGYKPTGRGKPASEFLCGAALDGGLPRINNLVDINNLVSLRHAHPISIFDADLLGDEVSIRFGNKQESYVFNPSGQSMDIAGLPVICRGPAQEPVGNAVKDSMLGKVHPQTTRVVAVVYGTRELPMTLLEACTRDLQALLTSHASASATNAQILAAGTP